MKQSENFTILSGALGIIGAMDLEIKLLVDALTDAHKFETGTLLIVEGRLGQTHVALAQSGIGKVNAAACTQALADRGVVGIVNTGVAGALHPQLEIGDFVIATDCVHHDVNLCNFGYELGQIPKSPPAFEADAVLSAQLADTLAYEEGVKVRKGRIASGDQFVCSPSDKQRIFSSFNALCCDMEAAAIAQVCHAHQLPFAVLRATSDQADGTQPEDYPEFEERYAHASARVVHAMLLAHTPASAPCSPQASQTAQAKQATSI